MADDKSPWGGDPDRGDTTTEAPEADAKKPAAGGEPPRNPWLVPETEETQRRSASIDDIFRGRKGGNPGGPTRSMREAGDKWLPWLLAGSVAAWLLATSVHVLAQDERGLVSTLGRYSGTISPGLNLTLPWPLQTVLRRQVGSETLTKVPEKDSEMLMPTRDGELIDVGFQVHWRITDLRAFAYGLPDGEAAIRRLADAQMRAAVSELSFDDIRSGKRQSELQQRVLSRMQRVLTAWRSGVTLSGIEINRAVPPGPLSETFAKIDGARRDADKNRELANKYREQVLQDARAKAGDFDKAYASYKVAPEVTRRRMYDQMTEQVLRNNPVILGGINAPPPAAAPADAKAAPPPPEGK